MPRGKAPGVRDLTPDPVYGNVLVTKLINRSMRDGKKSVAATQIYNALKLIEEKTGKDPIAVFIQALEAIKPTMEVRARRIGGAAYQVPTPVRGRRQESLGIRWLVESARSRSNSEFHTFAEKMAAEILDATNGEGLSIKKKQDIEKVAEANKAFSHFKW